ncbi:unnamed protein product, partial [Ectocarpus sp. 13 AM-2016]
MFVGVLLLSPVSVFSSVRSAACSSALLGLSSCFVSIHRGGFVVSQVVHAPMAKHAYQYPVHCPSAPRSSTCMMLKRLKHPTIHTFHALPLGKPSVQPVRRRFA